MTLPALDRTRSHGRGAALVATVGLAAVTASLLGGSPPASGSAASSAAAAAAAGGGDCAAWSATQTVCEFSSIGAAQDFYVPAWQTELGFEATGADGGSGVGAGAGSGGRGAVATADGVRFTAGEKLQVNVGGRPTDGEGYGGWNGGGAGGAGAGGGATDVRRAPYGTAERFLVAGGGGGGGTRQLTDWGSNPGAGGAGGWRNGVGPVSAGDDGVHGYSPVYLARGGAGGGETAPGGGGTGSGGLILFGCREESWPFSSGYASAGVPGTSSTGGLGGYIRSSRSVACGSSKGFGGGGGGGYFGGGGGGASIGGGAGGGGGSSYGPPGVVFTRSTSGQAGLNIGVKAPAGWRNDSVRVAGGTHLASPVAALNRAGMTDIFYLDPTGAAIHARGFDNSSGLRESRVGAVFAKGSTPAAVSRNASSLDLFGRGADNALWHISWNGMYWSEARRVGPVNLLAPLSSPTVASWGPSRLDVFGRSTGGLLVHYWSDNAGASWGHESLGRRLLTGDPTAVSWGPNRIDVLSVDLDGAVQHMYWAGSGWTDWIPWGGQGLSVLGSSPAISSREPGQLNIVVRNHRGDLVGRRFENSTWTWWESLGAVPARSGEKPALVTWVDGGMSVLVRGELEDGLWTKDLAWPR